jgi:hypothetical protein
MKTATAMNLTAMEQLTAMVTTMEGSMVTAKVMAIEGLTAMEGSTATAMAMNLMAMEGLMATATEMED